MAQFLGLAALITRFRRYLQSVYVVLSPSTFYPEPVAYSDFLCTTPPTRAVFACRGRHEFRSQIPVLKTTALNFTNNMERRRPRLRDLAPLITLKILG